MAKAWVLSPLKKKRASFIFHTLSAWERTASSSA